MFFRAFIVDYPTALDVTNLEMAEALPFLIAGFFDYSVVALLTITSAAILGTGGIAAHRRGGRLRVVYRTPAGPARPDGSHRDGRGVPRRRIRSGGHPD